MGKRKEQESRTLNTTESKWWKKIVKPLMRGDQEEAEAQFLHVLDLVRRVKLPKWTPFVKAETWSTADGDRDRHPDEAPVFVNSRYQVTVYEPEEIPGLGRIVHLCFKTNENDARHDWREMQRIKNELVGPEYEAVEIYPAESRVVDMANQFHLWVFLDSQIPFGMGYPSETGESRYVSDETDGYSRQRPFENDPGAMRKFTPEQMKEYIEKSKKAGKKY